MSTLQKRRDQLRALYGFDWPDDLFRFWEFARRLKPLEPLNALYESLHIQLTGPFEVLDGRFDNRIPHYSVLLHWRYYLDPPEFFTVLTGDIDRVHWGYWLDDPGGGKGSVASYYANDAFELSADGDSLFEALRLHLEHLVRDNEDYRADDPEYEAEYDERLRALAALRIRIRRHATDERPETGEEYFEKYLARAMRARQKHAQAMTPEGMGIVVPPEQYRPLKLNDKSLRRRLANGVEIDAAIRSAQRAVRDGYPGTALKLGKELWAAGRKYAGTAFDLLDAAYEALGRDVLRAVVREHRAHRDRRWLDVLQEDD
jgi:hypothetical protein